MKVGEVWCFRCVGVVLICLILQELEKGFVFLDLEAGEVRRYWRLPRTCVGFGVGEWHKWEA